MFTGHKLVSGQSASQVYGDVSGFEPVLLRHKSSVDGAGYSASHFDLLAKAGGFHGTTEQYTNEEQY